MHRELTFAGIALLLAVAASSADAQQPGRGRGFPPQGDPGQAQMPVGRGGRGGPVRDGQQQNTGSAVIAGRVVTADNGNPLRRAQVRISSAELNRTVSTDGDGRYSFTALPASRYRLQISKAGYVTLEYGQARPFEAGKPIDLADGQTLNKLDFSLPRGSVIAGRITDEFGEPVTDANVQAMRYQFVNGQRQLTPAGRQASTDDIGQFRVFGLMPGDYIVRATLRDNGLAALAMASNQTAEVSGYAPTYFPGASDIAQAQTVTVALGQELNTVFFALSPAKLAHVSGTVIDSQGKPLGGAVVVIRPSAGGGAGGAFNVGGGSPIRPDGSFVLNNVAPGEYTLDVQQRPRGAQDGGTALEFASMPLTVSGADVTGLTVVTTAGVSVSGSVVLQGQKTQPPSLRGIQIGAITPAGVQSLMGIAGRALGGGRVGDDGTFQVRGLSGPQLIRVNNVPTGWVLKSMTLEGQDITDAAFDFKSGHDVTGLTITLTDRVTDVSGSVHDDRGQVVKDYVLVAFADDARLWGGQSRFVRTARPNQDGVFDLKGLPPGKYLAAVVESLENGTQSDPAVLGQLKSQAKSFTLTEGQTLTLDLSFQP